MRSHRDHRIGHLFRSNSDFHLLIFDLICVFTALGAYTVNKCFANILNCVFMRSYFNDIMAGVLFPAYINIWLILKPCRLSGYIPLLLCTLAVGCFWEYVTPVYHPQSVSDKWDIAAYLAGTLLYCFVNSKAIKKSPSSAESRQ